jgi:hypothetical protein
MVTDSAALLLFAIRSSVKLSQQIRLAYVDSTRRRELTLPLPKFFTGTNEADAADFFNTEALGRKFIPEFASPEPSIPPEPRLPALLEKFEQHKLRPEERGLLIELHIKFRNLLTAEEGGWTWNGDQANGCAGAQEVYALLTIQQWRKGTDPTPSTLQRVAGTLIEIGIDYALTAPNWFDKNSRQGKAILGFLTALEQIDFKETELSEMPARLFVAVMETISENSALLSGDPKAQELIQVTTVAVSTAVAERLKTIAANPQLDAIGRRDARLRTQDWAELVFRATLASGGKLVLSDPAKFLGIKDAAGSAMVSAVGTSLLGLVLDNPKDIGKVLSREGLETLLQAALKTVGDHPEIFIKSGNQGVRALIAGLATDLAASEHLLRLDILPELTRLVLARTGQNLELFWPDLANKPETNLLMIAAKTTLGILSREPAAGEQWKPQFGREALLQISETVLDEIVRNPGWLLDDAGKLNSTLEEVLSSTFLVLRARADKRLSAATGVQILQIVVKTIVLRQEFVTKLPGGQPVVAAILDALLTTLFTNQPPAVAWRLVSQDAVTLLTERTLQVMGRHPLNPGTITILATTLNQEIKVLLKGQGFDLTQFGESLDNALK